MPTPFDKKNVTHSKIVRNQKIALLVGCMQIKTGLNKNEKKNILMILCKPKNRAHV